jgi:hypothetical protein
MLVMWGPGGASGRDRSAHTSGPEDILEPVQQASPAAQRPGAAVAPSPPAARPTQAARRSEASYRALLAKLQEGGGDAA